MINVLSIRNPGFLKQATGGSISDTAFIQPVGFGSLRNNYSDYLGFYFTIGSSAKTVTQLGRWIVSGNTGTHALKIVDMSFNVIASATIDTIDKTAGDFAYISVTPAILAANTSYAMISQELSGGDQWHDLTGIFNPSTTIDFNGAVYVTGGNTVNTVPSANTYIPVNFKYY